VREGILYVTMAAASADSSSAIEAMFQPSTRLRDLHGIQQRPPLVEFELLPQLTPQDVLATGISVMDFIRFLRKRERVVSMAPGVFISIHGKLGESFPVLRVWCRHLSFSVCLMDSAARAMATATCDFLVCLFANINIKMRHEGVFIGSDCDFLGLPPPVSGAALAFLFRESRSNVRSVCLSHCTLNEEHIRALSTESRPDMNVNLSSCELEDSVGCRNAFVECLRNNRGPTELFVCNNIDYRVLASTLRDNTRVTRIHLYCEQNGQDVDHIGQGELFRALAGNKGLVELNLKRFFINDANWSILCESLKGHPTLTCFSNALSTPTHHIALPYSLLSDEQRQDRTRMVAEMMRENTVLQAFNFLENEYDDLIYAEAILPHLVSNLYRPRVLAVTETRNRQLLKKVLGRSLYSVRSNPDLVWMFLSNNVDVFIPLNQDCTTSTLALRINGILLSQSALKLKQIVGLIFVALCDIWIHFLAARLFRRSFPNQFLTVTLLRVVHEVYIAVRFARADADWTLVWMLHHAVSTSIMIGYFKLLWPTWFQYATEGLVVSIQAAISPESATLVFTLYVGLIGYRAEQIRQAFKILDAT
jgi:hypothetical protein